jgi:hypothetical protein
LGVDRIERVGCYAALARRTTAVDPHGLVAILEVPTADAVQQWGSRQ